MNNLLKDVLMILSGIIGGCLFFYIKNKITNRIKTKTAEALPEVKEAFSLNKFTKGLLNVSNPVMWSKDIASIFSLRKLIIVGVIIGVIYGYGYFKGVQNKPIQVNLDYNQEWTMKLNGEELYKPKNSSDVFIRDSKTHVILKQIKAKDMGILREKLRPFAFELKPIGIMGGGISEVGATIEGGAGISFFRYWQWRLDTFLTNRGAYIGTSYKLDKFKLNNSSLGIGLGKGYKGDNRVLLYYKWEF